MFYLDTRLLIIFFLVLALLVGLWRLKKKIGQEMIIAILFSLFITSYVQTIYEGFNVTLGRINLFPLTVWTASLVLLREIYKRLKGRYKFFTTYVIYILILLIFEYVGYYALDIKASDNGYQSLLGLGIVHGPIVIQVFYLTAGPIYLLVTDYLEVK